MSKLSSDYIITSDPDKGLLERYGYTKQDFQNWLVGKSVEKKQLKPEKVEKASDEELDSFFS